MTKIKQIHLLAKAHDTLLAKLGAEAVLFFKQRFNEQNWVDSGTQTWKQRRRFGRKGNKTLVNTGALKRSIRIISKSFDTIKIGSDMPYAKIHNEGGKIPITPKMRRFFFAKAREIAGNTRKRNTPMPPDAQYYINLAVTKKNTLNIPKRQFIGPSKYLDQRLYRIAQAEITKILSS